MKYLKTLSAIYLVFSLFIGCKKDSSNNTQKKREIIEQLGFKNYTIIDGSSNGAIKFNSIEEAKEYFKPYLRTDIISTNLSLNYRLAAKVNFDYILHYIRGRLSVERVMEDGEGYGPSYPDNGGWVVPYDSEATNEDGSPCDYGNPTAKKWAGWAGHFASFAYNKNQNGTYTTSEFDSGLMGFTLGVSWHHGQGSSTTTLDANGFLVVTVTGTQYYNIIVEDIGTVFQQHVKITVKINPCTGVYTMTVANA